MSRRAPRRILLVTLPLLALLAVTATLHFGGTPAAAPSGCRELVVLVHGMGRTPLSMRPLARALEREGYEVLNFGYPSRRNGAEHSARLLAERVALEEGRPEVRRVHLVGHSLGNILIRWMVANERPGKLGRIVMLAPPNQGARRADLAAPWLTWLSRPLPDLTTDPNSLARTIRTPAGVEVGVIAGSHDSTVRLPETHLDAETDHVVVDSGHTFIMRHRAVHELTASFLREGRFPGLASR